MERNVHAQVKIHVLLKQRSPRGHITLPLMPILISFSVKSIWTTSFNVSAVENCSLLPKEVSLVVRWGLKGSQEDARSQNV